MSELNFPNSPSVNDTYTDVNSAVWRYDGEKWDVITRSTKRAFVGAKVILTTDHALTSVASPIDWDSESFDTGVLWASSASSRFTITENGFYRINAQIQTTSAGTGSSYTISIRKNGSAISSDTIASNQFVVYDEIIQLAVGDYVEVYASESTSSGAIESDTSFFEITQVGLSLGTGISTWSAFSGARASLTAAVSCTSNTTPIDWDATEFDQNADVLGSTYWTVGDPSKLTIKVDGYYRVKTMVATNAAGGADTYTITLQENSISNLETTTLGPSQTAMIDEIYNFSANDYIEIVVSNSESTGQINSDAYLEITRLGV